MTTLKKVEQTLIGMYGIENIYRCKHEYYSREKKAHVSMSLYYRKSDNKHIGSHKPETREGWYYDLTKKTDFLPHVVMI